MFISRRGEGDCVQLITAQSDARHLRNRATEGVKKYFFCGLKGGPPCLQTLDKKVGDFCNVAKPENLRAKRLQKYQLFIECRKLS